MTNNFLQNAINNIRDNTVNVTVEGCKFTGIYSFKAVSAITGEERDLGEVSDSPNMIMNSGLDALGTSQLLFNTIVVGTSSSTVLATQTSLGNQIASTTTIQAQSDGTNTTSPQYGWTSITMRFGQGVAAGNLTEVGIYTSSGVLFSRALIVDSSNNPTTLTILSDEYLDVTYQFRWFPNLNDVTTTVVLGGNTYNVTARPMNVNNLTYGGYFNYGLAAIYSQDNCFWQGTIGSITTQPSGSQYFEYPSIQNYTNGTYQLTNVFSAGLNNANFSGGIQALSWSTSKGQIQIGFSPAIPKDTFTILTLNITIQWAAA